VIGSMATTFTDPGAAARSGNDDIDVAAAAGSSRTT